MREILAVTQNFHLMSVPSVIRTRSRFKKEFNFVAVISLPASPSPNQPHGYSAEWVSENDRDVISLNSNALRSQIAQNFLIKRNYPNKKSRCYLLSGNNTPAQTLKKSSFECGVKVLFKSNKARRKSWNKSWFTMLNVINSTDQEIQIFFLDIDLWILNQISKLQIQKCHFKF